MVTDMAPSLTGTCADDGCCKEWEEHGGFLSWLYCGMDNSGIENEGQKRRKPRASEDGQGFHKGQVLRNDAFRLLSP